MTIRRMRYEKPAEALAKPVPGLDPVADGRIAAGIEGWQGAWQAIISLGLLCGAQA
ncbi:hypothetical protein [Actibacterium sp.]|uniref:hypothetical protein n=1 Tax=Actibacterium sp. TaxID=1872125 RepID=UPI00257E18EB|nr:hypothetical protein [Actibacterium sp.]